MIKIAIDVSTTNTGFVILDQDNKFIYKTDIAFRAYNNMNLVFNSNLLEATLSHIIDNVLNEEQRTNEIMIGIELSNFSNPKITNRFHLYSGMFIAFLTSYLLPNKNIIFKTFNSNNWQSLIGCKNSDEREVRKEIARDYARDNCETYNEDGSEDTCDAYCIAHILEKIITTEELYVNTKKTKNAKQRKRQELYRIEKKINTRLSQIALLDKFKNSRKIAGINSAIATLQRQKEIILEELRQ